MHGKRDSVVSLRGKGTDCGTPIALGLSLAGSRPSRYDSWKTGAPVINRDEHGAINGKDVLSAGTASRILVGANGAFVDCTFVFVIESVRTSASLYRIAIGSASPVAFTRREMQARNWSVAINVAP